ncbi:hypothetical protein BD626DRAFT_500379 [Schizophyllum amplum]|uniref:Uncharacterized protein n=1 Tax=Schizophyllum amplum TaxID=97359 RepID=A0A550CAB7_9AGAR|nr:hypothetical protein BD626DRAFT_500379 [Auriculariopsis ampla]
MPLRMDTPLRSARQIPSSSNLVQDRSLLTTPAMPRNVSPAPSSPSSASSSRRQSIDMGRPDRRNGSTASATIGSRHPSLRLGKLPDRAPIPPSLLDSPLLHHPDSIFRRGIATPRRPSEEDERWLQDTVPLVPASSPTTPTKARRLSLSGGVREEGALVRRPPTQRMKSAQMRHRPSPSLPSMRSVMMSPPLVRPPRSSPASSLPPRSPRQYSDSLLPIRQRCSSPYLSRAWPERTDYFAGLPIRTHAR